MFPNFWILPLNIWIPNLEIYIRNSTRIPSSHNSRFVIIPTYVGQNASTYFYDPSSHWGTRPKRIRLPKSGTTTFVFSLLWFWSWSWPKTCQRGPLCRLRADRFSANLNFKNRRRDNSNRCWVHRSSNYSLLERWSKLVFWLFSLGVFHIV